MRIANLLDKSFATTMIERGAVCYSACSLLWFAGSNRGFGGKLGVHRLSLSRNETSVRKTERAIGPATQNVVAFLLHLGVPQKIIEKMNETPPTDLFIIDHRWLIEQDLDNAVGYRPSFLDVVERQCGEDPFRTASKAGRMVDREHGINWLQCLGDSQEKNQILELKSEILPLIYADEINKRAK